MATPDILILRYAPFRWCLQSMFWLGLMYIVSPAHRFW